MKPSISCHRLLAGSFALGLVLFAVGSTRGTEEARRFLEGLRERGYYDTAQEYLEVMRASPLLTDQEFKQSIDYEIGVTLIESARTGRAIAEREQQLGEAKEKFEKFIQDHPNHKLVAGANTKLADLLVERGNILVDLAGNPNKADQKTQLLGEARKLYDQAQKVFEGLEKRFLDEHGKFPKLLDETKDAAQFEARAQVRANLLQTRLSLATVIYQSSKTHAPGSKESQDALSKSAEKYKEMYEKYSIYMAGLYGHMWEARCYKELAGAETDQAKSKEYYEKTYYALEDLLLEEDDSPPFQLLKNKALVIFLETALQEKGAKRADALTRFVEWERAAPTDEESSEEGLALKYLAADIMYQQSKTEKDAKKKRELLAAGKKLFETVYRFPGEYKGTAQEALARPEYHDPSLEPPEPETFAEARDRASQALGRTQDTSLAEDEIAKARDDAVKYFRMALAMKEPTTPTDDINVIRYYLSHLYWSSEDLYEAAVMGHFMAVNYPNSTGGRDGAVIAMAAYAKLAGQAEAELKTARANDDAQDEIDRLTDDVRFFGDSMVRIARDITERRKGQPEADQAWVMLISNALERDKLEEAQKYLDNISPDSEKRGAIELILGQKLWSGYLTELRDHQAAKKQYEALEKQTDNPPPQVQLDQMKADLDKTQVELDRIVANAQQVLEEGIGRMRKPIDAGTDQPDYTLVASVLSLAQIYLGAGEPEKAVGWLDDGKVGAVTLVKAGNAATDRENFAVATYKTALRAYVGVQETAKAQEAMQALEKLVGEAGDAEAAAKLTQIYLALGLELKGHLAGLRAAGKPQEANVAAHSFEAFLDIVRNREEGHDFASLIWVAKTFVSLGDSLASEGESPPDEARRYYGKAAETYQQILGKLDDPSFGAPDNVATAIQVLGARCLRKTGEYEAAIDVLLKILQERESMLDAQVEVALTYQAWGMDEDTKDDLPLTIAYQGTKLHEEVWGWGLLARRVQRNLDKFSDVFHKARYNLAVCRFALGKKKSTKSTREQYYEQAAEDILKVYKLYPKMGGPEWYDQYDQLLKQIQEALGKEPTGLNGAESR
ncbi:MAG TPA: hypothetical protein VMY42_19990 [Thermoguttaceae bacterium]|nr:hypothetical protein [Thermoguttaceae bacterium]